MRFKAKFEKSSTERRDITKELYYDVYRGQGGISNEISVKLELIELFRKKMLENIK
jgi:hypothetical protein